MTPAPYLKIKGGPNYHSSPLSALCKMPVKVPKLSHAKAAIAKQRGEMTPSPIRSEFSTPLTAHMGCKKLAEELRKGKLFSVKKKLKF